MGNKTASYLFFILVFSVGYISVIHAQNIEFNGAVTDTLQVGIPGANLFATPIVASHPKSFAISDEKGRFKLYLKKNLPYIINITYMGYGKITDTLLAADHFYKKYVLTTTPEELDPIMIQTKMAMVIKEDTTTYRVAQFLTGEERKLKEILKKLPGIEIDNQGRVYSNGKRIGKLTVNDKDFFGGDTKLGVENIPADVVEEVEVLENYTEVAFMKGLDESNMIALNIKLKQGKKNFLFGESQAGVGIQNRYLFKPTLFYYSPHTTLNLLGNLNNSGDAPLDNHTINRFSSGYTNWDFTIKSTDEGIYKFSSNTLAYAQKTDFGAINLNQEISPTLILEGYSIWAHQKIESRDETKILYQGESIVKEERESNETHKEFSNFNKIKLRYRPKTNQDLAYLIQVNKMNNSTNNFLTSRTGDSLNDIMSKKHPELLSVEQFLRYNTQSSYEHTTEITANYFYEKKENFYNWQFNQPIFPENLPVINDEEDFEIVHHLSSKINKADLSLKHYWVLSPFQHLAPSLGGNFFHQKYSSLDFQHLQDGNFNSFETAGFGNELKYGFLDVFIGLKYKFKWAKFTFRPGIFYHQYFWTVQQFSKKIVDKNKGILLPEFWAEYQFSPNNKFEFRYNKISKFVEASYFANRLQLVNFNQLVQGNENLENSLQHQFSLSYHRFNAFKKFFATVQASYSRSEKAIRNMTEIIGVNFINYIVYTDLPENNYNLDAQLSKFYGNYKFKASASMALKDYIRIINTEQVDYKLTTFSYSFSTETSFKSWPNFEVGINQNFNNYKSNISNVEFVTTEPYGTMNFQFLNNFIFKSAYTYRLYYNKTDHKTNVVNDLNASLLYTIKNSSWSIEVSGKNLTNEGFQNINFANQFMIFNQKVYIQPIQIIFSAYYKL